MKRLSAVSIPVLAALCSAPALADRWQAIEKLAGTTPVEVLVHGKSREYLRIASQAPLIIPIQGPARVRIVSRAEVPQGSRVVTYTLRATEAGKAVETLDTETSVADDIRLPSGGPPLAKSRRMTFALPAGTHRLALSLSGIPTALVRIQQSAGSAEEPMVSITPLRARRSVTVDEGEKLITYYSTTPGQPVEVRVVGPTTLELLTRLDFDPSMRGTQSYRLRVSEAGKPARTMEFKTTKAVAASFTNLRDRVPSKFDLVRIPVPDGTHEYAIELVEPARGTGGAAEIHARIPAPSVGSEE